MSIKTKETAKSKALKWFAKQGWEVHAFQKAAIDAYLAGKGGLVNAPTGSGKTYSLAIPSIVSHNPKKKGIHLLWIKLLCSLEKEIK